MGRRLALLIATYQFQDPGLRQLTAPAHDTEALAAVLRDPDVAGFEVTTLINEPHHVVGEVVGDFFRDRRRDDLTLLYFSGHGLKDEDGRLYLAMANTRRDSLLFTSLSAEHVDYAMSGCMSRQKVLILDCCYSGAFPAGHLAKADDTVHALERFQGKGRTVLTASDATQYSFEGDRVHGQAPQSVFTHHLVAGLRDGGADLDGDGDITIDELYAYVHDRVVAEMPHQRPKKQDNVEGRTIIAHNINWTLPPYLDHAMNSPLADDRLGALTALAHLHKIGNPAVQARIHHHITTLTTDDSRKVSTAAQTLLKTLPTPPPTPSPLTTPHTASSATPPLPTTPSSTTSSPQTPAPPTQSSSTPSSSQTPASPSPSTSASPSPQTPAPQSSPTSAPPSPAAQPPQPAMAEASTTAAQVQPEPRTASAALSPAATQPPPSPPVTSAAPAPTTGQPQAAAVSQSSAVQPPPEPRAAAATPSTAAPELLPTSQVAVSSSPGADAKSSSGSQTASAPPSTTTAPPSQSVSPEPSLVAESERSSVPELDVDAERPSSEEEVEGAPEDSSPNDRPIPAAQLQSPGASPSSQDGGVAAAGRRRVALVWGGIGVVVASVIAVLVLVVGGSGGGGGGAAPVGESASVTVVAQAFVDAVTNKDRSGVLAVLCTADRESVERNGFPVADVNAVLNSVEVDSSGTTATLNVTLEQSSTGDHTQTTFPMLKESGEWRICQIGAAPPSS